MNIAIFTDNYHPQVSGITIGIDLLKGALKKNKHKCLVFCPDYPSRDSEHDPKDVVHLPSIKYLSNPERYLGLPFSQKILKTFFSFKPDIIHIHSVATVGMTGILLSKIFKIPVVYTYHSDYSSKEYRHYFSILKSIPNSPQILKKADVFTSNLVDAIIAPSKKVVHHLKENVKSPVFHIPNAPNPQLFRPNLRASVIKNQIIYVGRLDPEKSPHLIFEAAKIINEKFKIKLVIVGSGSQEPELKQKYAHLEFVDWLGNLPNHKIPHLLHRSYLFLTPSTSEVHPYTTLESISCATPVVCAKDGAYQDVVINGKTGYQVPKSPQSLAKACLKILRNPQLRSIFSLNCQQQSRLFSLDNQVKDTINVYNSLYE